MNDRTSAAVTHFVCGGLTMLSGVRGLVRPHELSQYSHVWNEFLYQYGHGVSASLVGALLIGAGLLTLHAKDPLDGTKELNFTYEAELPLAPVMAAFLFWIGITTAISVLPYTGERGVQGDGLGDGCGADAEVSLTGQRQSWIDGRSLRSEARSRQP